MSVHRKLLTKENLRWQSLRPFNVIILSSFVFFFLIGAVQSYTLFNSTPTFTAPIFIPILILLLCSLTLYAVVKEKDVFTQRIMPAITFIITLFITINSHFQEQIYLNSFLYLVLLLPLFYAYLLAYNTHYLIINNTFILLCYIFSSVMGNTDSLVFLLNCTFLITLCYLTIYTQFRTSESHHNQLNNDFEQNSIMSKKSSLYLNSIIHDIRQPLSSLSLYSHLLEKKLVNTQHLQLAQSIKHSSEELDRWISSLLDLSRLESNAITPVITEFKLSSALSPIIQKYQQQAIKKEINFSIRLPDITIKGDIRLITSIVDVLLSNAIVHGSQKKRAHILLSARYYNQQAKLQVWNQGKKIEASLFESLFDEVAQAKNPLKNKSKGIGLGLAIAQRKAHLCETHIEAQSSNKGSCFSLLLKTGFKPQKRKELRELSNQCLNCKILLIDDDEEILIALNVLLEGWGYSVDSTNTAEEGLLKYSESEYDLVISNYLLPNQKTGLDVLKKIRNGTPSILLTGEVDLEKLKEVQESSEILDYMILNKPVKPASLRSMLKQLL